MHYTILRKAGAAIARGWICTNQVNNTFSMNCRCRPTLRFPLGIPQLYYENYIASFCHGLYHVITGLVWFTWFTQDMTHDNKTIVKNDSK